VRDVGVLVARATPTALPAGVDMFMRARAEPSLGGLGLNVHTIEIVQPLQDRRFVLNSSQSAAQITEDATAVQDDDFSSLVLGVANWGSLNDLDNLRVWPSRIAGWINQICGSRDADCTTDAGAVGKAAVTQEYVGYVIDHELGHTLKCAPRYNKRFGGYHERSGTDKMEQFPKYTDRKGKVKFFLSEPFGLNCQEALDIQGPAPIP